MALTGDFGKFKKLVKGFEDMALPGGKAQARVLAGVALEVRGELQREYSGSVGPDGDRWPLTARRKPALVSNKLAQSWKVQVIEGGIAGRSVIPWLTAHQEGHTFPPRQQAAKSRFYDIKNRRIKLGRLNARAVRMKFVEERTTAAHNVKARVLPARPQVPEGHVPAPWQQAINTGAVRGFLGWRASMVG